MPRAGGIDTAESIRNLDRIPGNVAVRSSNGFVSKAPSRAVNRNPFP